MQHVPWSANTRAPAASPGSPGNVRSRNAVVVNDGPNAAVRFVRMRTSLERVVAGHRVTVDADGQPGRGGGVTAHIDATRRHHGDGLQHLAFAHAGIACSQQREWPRARACHA